jgi:hypothetical protein
MSERGKGLPKAVIVLIGLAAAVLVFIAATAIFARPLTEWIIPHTIQGRLADPAALDGSRVVAGDPATFIFGNPSAKLTLTSQGMKKLLATDPVFNDCHDNGRACSSPTWAESNDLLPGVSRPGNSVCARSYKPGTRGLSQLHMLCVDPATDALYYYEFTLGER